MKSACLALLMCACPLTVVAQNAPADPCSDESTRKEDSTCVLSSNTAQPKPASSPSLKVPRIAPSGPLAGAVKPETEFSNSFSPGNKLEALQKNDKVDLNSPVVKGMQVEKSGTRF
jgi:hypothetical protein